MKRGPKPVIIEDICPKCGRFKVLKRGYCSSCYAVLLRNGKIDKLEVDPEPTKLTSVQEEILTGTLLGDGALFKHKPTHKPYYSVQRQASDSEYIDWQLKMFENLCVKDAKIKVTDVYDNRTGQTYYNVRFQTRRLTILEDWYSRWYPNGKKIVPNITLTSPIVALWFSDDGSLGIQKVKDHKYLRLKFSTDAFKVEDTEYLASLLEDKYKQKFPMFVSGNGYNIQASHKAALAVIYDIAKWLPPGMERKLSCLQDILSTPERLTLNGAKVSQQMIGSSLPLDLLWKLMRLFAKKS